MPIESIDSQKSPEFRRFGWITRREEILGESHVKFKRFPRIVYQIQVESGLKSCVFFVEASHFVEDWLK